MRQQRVWGAGHDTAAEAVAGLTAVQSQEHWYARWSVGQRTRRAKASEVDRAFDDGRFLRTHVLRPTWHYVAATDLGWLIELSGPRVDASNARRYRDLELDRVVLNRANDQIAATVADGHRTRRELGDALERRGIATDGQRLAHIVMHAELTGIVCSGAMRGKQHTYASFDERVPSRKGPRGDEALTELAKRFFTTRGPATLRDFAWWSGLPMADARRGLEIAAPQLEHRTVDDRELWFRGARSRTLSAPRVDLVQCFDETIISYRESRDVLQTRRVGFPVPGVVDGFSHVLLLDGRLLGHWRVARRGSAPDRVETHVRTKLTAAERAALAAAVQRFERFLGEPPAVGAVRAME
jgi:Winged helix DNA-binding domain